MYDIERINILIKDIDKFFSELKSIGLSKENMNNPEKFYSSSMLMFSIINRAVDMAGEIIIKNDFGMPASYEQYFEVLGKKGIIEKKLSEELRKLAKDRNIFAHQYFSMNEKQVLDVSKRIYFVRDFVERIKKIIEKENKLK